MIKRLLSLILALSLFTVTLLVGGLGPVAAAGNIDPADWTMGENVSVTNGYLTNSANWQAATYTGTYENFTLDVKLDNSARIFFASTNAWTDKLYVEADFGGALILRSSADADLATADVALTADTLIKIVVEGDNVKVYADDVLKIDYSGAATKAGSVGIIFTVVTAKVSDFKAAENVAAAGNIDPADWTMGENVSVTNGYLTNSANWQAATYTGTYENFTLDVKLDNSARIFFASTNEWTDRMYVEADFGGALILRSSADADLATADVALTADTLIKIVVEGDNVKVYADDVLKIDYSGAAAKAGSVGIIFTVVTAKVSDFIATENVVAAGNIDPADWTMGENVSVTNGYLTNSANWQAATYTGTYENFTLDVKLDNSARIFFASTNAWTDKLYVEADFGGALILRSSADADLAAANVALTADTLIRIVVEGDNVKVYADDVLKIDYSGAAAKAGSVGIIFTVVTAKVSDFIATENVVAAGNIDPADWTMGENVSVTNGYLTNSANWQAATYTGTYENFTLDVKLDNSARIFFASTNAWTDKLYVEADFGGALILRSSADADLATADVALTADTLIKIVVEGDNVKVYADDVLKIDYSGAATKAGSVGIIFTVVTAKVSDFIATESGSEPGGDELTFDGVLVYEDDFSDPSDFADDWDVNEDMQSSFGVSDGALNVATGFKGATLPISLSSFEWDLYLNASSRLVFYSDDENPYGLWLGDRYYLEVDFGGALILRDGYDVTLRSIPVQLTPGVYNRVTIKAANGTIQAFMHGNSTPLLQYTDLSLTSGNFAVISTVSAVSYDYMALYELPEDYELVLIDDNSGEDEEPLELTDAHPVDTSVKDGTRKGYFFDFSDESHFWDYWFGVTETYLENGMLKSTGQVSGGIIDAKKMKNTEIDTVVNNNTRITFRISGSNIWTDKRYYVEIDYTGGGALLLRADDEITALAAADLGDLVPGQNTRVVVRTVGTKVEVFLNGATTPALTYDGLEEREGYVGYQIIYKKTAMSYFSVAELTDNGEYIALDSSNDDISDDSPKTGDKNLFILILLLSSVPIFSLTVLRKRKQSPSNI